MADNFPKDWLIGRNGICRPPSKYSKSGYYLTASALLALIGLLMMRETKDESLASVKV